MSQNGESKMKYNFCYKYYEVTINNANMILELSYDNTLGIGFYGARTNALFRDVEGDLSCAAGSAKTEMEALNSCLNALNEALQCNNSYGLCKSNERFNATNFRLKEVDLPFHVTFLLGKNSDTTVYFKIEANTLIVLSDKMKFTATIEHDAIYTLKKHIKKIKHSDANGFTKEYLEQNNFFPVFNHSIW